MSSVHSLEMSSGIRSRSRLLRVSAHYREGIVNFHISCPDLLIDMSAFVTVSGSIGRGQSLRRSQPFPARCRWLISPRLIVSPSDGAPRRGHWLPKPRSFPAISSSNWWCVSSATADGQKKRAGGSSSSTGSKAKWSTDAGPKKKSNRSVRNSSGIRSKKSHTGWDEPRNPFAACLREMACSYGRFVATSSLWRALRDRCAYERVRFSPGLKRAGCRHQSTHKARGAPIASRRRRWPMCTSIT